MLSVYFETFGCQMNVADSAMLGDLLSRHGYHATTDAAGADLIVINTCSVRENAEKRARARIVQHINLRRNHRRDQQVWVIGCMAQRMGESLKTELPGVDRVIGAEEIENVHEHILAWLDKKSDGVTHKRPEGGVTAFVPVMRGCDNFCTYCIVPYVRGREHSIPLMNILDTVKDLVRGGVAEVTLLGQNVNSYRDDVSGGDFPALLEHVCGVDGIKRVRFTTSHPKDCGERLIRAVAELPKVCKHIHLPVQSGSSRVLELMNRTYTRDDYRRVAASIRAISPAIDITTDIMVGFPSETDADFQDTLSLVRETGFAMAFMFAYSPRPGTTAAGMGDPVPEGVAKERLNALIALQTRITREQYDSMVGRRIEAMLTGRQKERDHQWMGQDNGCRRVLLACDDDLAGTILPLRVVRSSGMTLLCERE